MFSPVAPILSAASSDEASAHVLVQVEAIHTVLTVLARMADVAATPDLEGLARQAELSAALADLDPKRVASMTQDLDAIAAALQAGFFAIEKARLRGHPARAAAGLLHAETREAFAATLAAAIGTHASA